MSDKLVAEKKILQYYAVAWNSKCPIKISLKIRRLTVKEKWFFFIHIEKFIFLSLLILLHYVPQQFDAQHMFF